MRKNLEKNNLTENSQLKSSRLIMLNSLVHKFTENRNFNRAKNYKYNAVKYGF